jgi:O-antigen/teichoic acid export membrane protein
MSEIVTDESIELEIEATRAWRVLLGNFATLATGEAAARLISLVAILIMARRVGPDGFGVITFGLTVIGWFALVQDSGTELLNVRDISRTPHRFRTIVEPVLGLRLTLSLLAMGGFAIVVSTVAKAEIHRDTLIGFAVILPALALNLRWMMLGVHEAKAVAVGNIGARLLLTVLVVTLVDDRHDVARIPYLYARAEYAYALIVLTVAVRRYGLLVPRVKLPSWVRTLRESAPVMATSMARGLIVWFDVFIIGVVLEPSDVGIYGAAAKPALFATGVLGLFAVSFLASFSPVQRDVGDRLISRTMRTYLAVTVPAAIVLSAGASFFLTLLFGSKYSSGAAVLAILAWKIPLAALVGPFGAALLSGGYQKVNMRNSFIVAVFVVVADLIAVDAAGIKGVAVVGVASTVLGLILGYRSALSRGLTPSFAELLGRPLRAAPHGRRG